jgi:hypothetical protein
MPTDVQMAEIKEEIEEVEKRGFGEVIIRIRYHGIYKLLATKDKLFQKKEGNDDKGNGR